MEQGQTLESPGKYLKSIRQSRKISLTQVAQETRIRETILMAIEEDNYGDMPRLYIKGFLSAYARCLGLDPDRVLSLQQKYSEEQKLSSQGALEHQPDPGKKGANIRLVIALSVLLLVALLFYASFKLLPRLSPSLKSEESRPPSPSSIPSSPPTLKETGPPTADQPGSNKNQPEDINTDKGP